MRALVVDDSRAVRTIVAKLLRDVGFDPVCAGGGAQALARLQEGGPWSLLLVDRHMADMRGDELVRDVRARGLAPEARIVLVVRRGERDAGADTDADAVMCKPFAPGALVAALLHAGLDLPDPATPSWSPPSPTGSP